MVARQGLERRWHFAHKPPFDRCADPDKALHDAAKALIVQGFSDARDRKGEYLLGVPCDACRTAVSRNAAVPGASVEVEKVVALGTRSDLVVNQPDREPVVIEIVVTHDMEPETRDRYKEAGIPVLAVYPTWDTLARLESAIIADDTLNVPLVRCAACKDAADRKRRKEEEIRSRVDSMLERLNERRRSASAQLPFRPWTHDRFGRPMFPHIRPEVYTNAIVLTELGFVQAGRKPWLFYFQLPGGVIFADCGSSDVIPIWKVYGNLEEHYGEIAPALIEGTLVRCRAAGAHVRVSSYAQGVDQRKDPVETDPTRGVDRAMLSQLLDDAARMFPEEERRAEQSREAARKAQRAEFEREQAIRGEGARRIPEEVARRWEAEGKQWAQLNEWIGEWSLPP